MCRRVTCTQCGKATFAGCGAHVEQVLAGVPQSERCQGHQAEKGSGGEAGGEKREGWRKLWPF